MCMMLLLHWFESDFQREVPRCFDSLVLGLLRHGLVPYAWDADACTGLAAAQSQPTMLPPALFPPMMPSPRPLDAATFGEGMATTQPGDAVLMMQAWQVLQEHTHEAEASNVVAPAEPAIAHPSCRDI